MSTYSTIYLKDILDKGYCESEREYNFVKWMYDNLINKSSAFADELKKCLTNK